MPSHPSRPRGRAPTASWARGQVGDEKRDKSPLRRDRPPAYLAELDSPPSTAAPAKWIPGDDRALDRAASRLENSAKRARALARGRLAGPTAQLQSPALDDMQAAVRRLDALAAQCRPRPPAGRAKPAADKEPGGPGAEPA